MGLVFFLFAFSHVLNLPWTFYKRIFYKLFNNKFFFSSQKNYFIKKITNAGIPYLYNVCIFRQMLKKSLAVLSLFMVIIFLQVDQANTCGAR